MLAAGSSSRFGTTKQLAELGGTPLVAHVVAAAGAAGLDPVVVVLGHDADRVTAALPAGTEVVRNPDHAAGQATSLRVGLDRLASTDATAVAVLLGDEPDIDPVVVRDVVAAFHRGQAEVARAVYADRPGHPLVAARSAWAALRTATGDAGARAADVTPAAIRVEGPAPTDVDTPADLAALRARRP